MVENKSRISIEDVQKLGEEWRKSHAEYKRKTEELLDALKHSDASVLATPLIRKHIYISITTLDCAVKTIDNFLIAFIR